MQAAVLLPLLLSLASISFITCNPVEESVGRSACWTYNGTCDAFKSNVKNLVATLEQKAPLNKGFYNSTLGENSDKVYGFARCRGDLLAEDCASCLKLSAKLSYKSCENSSEQVVTYKGCILYYSYEDFFSHWNGGIDKRFLTYKEVNDSNTVGEKGRTLMSELSIGALTDPLLFKAGFVDVGDAGKRYGLAQCNPVLNKTSCAECLKTALDNLFSEGYTTSGSAQRLGCGMWYDDYPFYRQPSSPPPPPTPSAGPPPKIPSPLLMQLGTLTMVLLLLMTI